MKNKGSKAKSTMKDDCHERGVQHRCINVRLHIHLEGKICRYCGEFLPSMPIVVESERR